MSQELDLREYIAIIRKRIWLIIAVVLLATALTAVYSIFFKEEVYEASTKIIVNRTTAQAALDQLDLNEINTNIRMIDTYKEIIKTPAILDKVVEAYPQFQTTSDELITKIKVSSVNNTQVMTLVIRDTDYHTAAEMVNAVSKVFQNEIPSLFNVENVSILNYAKVEANAVPVEPNVPLNIALAFIVSLMLAIGAAFLLEYLDDTIKTEDDVLRTLDLPTLAMISRVNAEELRSTKVQKPTYAQVGDKTHVPVSK